VYRDVFYLTARPRKDVRLAGGRVRALQHPKALRARGAEAFGIETRERAKAAAAFEKALQLAEAERAINPRQPDVVAEIADSASMLGRRETALDAIRAVERMDTSDAADQFMIAGAYEQLGERALALKWLGRALANGYDWRRVESSPSFAALRKDPRFAGLVTKFAR